MALAGFGEALRPYRRALVTAGALAVARTVVELALPWPLSFTVDHALEGRPLPGVLAALALSPVGVVVGAACVAVVLAAAVGLLDYGGVVLAEQQAERFGARVRRALVGHALRLSLRWHDRMSSGELVSRLGTDVGRVLDAVVALATRLVPDGVLVVGVLIVLVTIDPVLGLVGVLAVPVLGALAVGQRRRVRGAESAARTEAGRLAATSSDLLRNVRAVQAFGRHRRAMAVFADRNDAVLRRRLHAVEVEARWAPRADVVLAIGASVVLVLGARGVLSGQLSTGTLLVVLAYLADLYRPVRSLARLSSTLAKAAAAAARLREVLECREEVPERPRPTPVAPLRHAVRFHRVSFGYDPSRPVLSGLDLVVRRGETVCVTGPSGAGKSTLLYLLLRLYDVDRGRISYDDVDVRRLSLPALRRQIAYVPQDPWLFDGTIAQNIAFGSPEATRAAVLTAAASARVREFARWLPSGIDTPIGEAGSRLSGGQRRRVALARAIIDRPPMLLLDEPTASLDAESATAVIRAITAAARDRTVLIVTHDDALTRMADRHLVLDRHGGIATQRMATAAAVLNVATNDRKEVNDAHPSSTQRGNTCPVPSRTAPLAQP